VTEAEKSDRIRGARAVLHLALFEGFGLPVVEGFAHGVPVLCSDRASLPEVAGGAALIADPLDVEAMARAMVEIAADRELRDRLRTRGLERARAFRPGRAARAWATLHAEVAAS
jgi:glycosyltransferase involved in cell wall biosynthesis